VYHIFLYFPVPHLRLEQVTVTVMLSTFMQELPGICIRDIMQSMDITTISINTVTIVIMDIPTVTVITTITITVKVIITVSIMAIVPMDIVTEMVLESLDLESVDMDRYHMDHLLELAMEHMDHQHRRHLLVPPDTEHPLDILDILEPELQALEMQLIYHLQYPSHRSRRFQ